MIKNSIKYTIRNDFSISKYNDLDILKVIEKDFNLYQKGIIKIENQKLLYIGTDKQSFFFSPLDRELYAIDKAEISIKTTGDKRKMILKIDSKRLDRYNASGLVFMIVFIIIMAILTKSWYSLIIPTVFVSGFLILLHFFSRLRFFSMIKRIIIREELTINNAL